MAKRKYSEVEMIEALKQMKGGGRALATRTLRDVPGDPRRC